MLSECAVQQREALHHEHVAAMTLRRVVSHLQKLRVVALELCDRAHGKVLRAAHRDLIYNPVPRLCRYA